MPQVSSSCHSKTSLRRNGRRRAGPPAANHAGHHGNANLLATTSHAGILANSVGAAHAGLLAIFVDATSA